MKVSILPVVALLLSFAVAQTNEFPFEGEVVASKLNVRVKPTNDADSTIVAVLSEGDRVTVLGREGSFYEIQAPKGAGVWVDGRYLDVNGSTGTVKRKTKVRTDSRITAPAVGELSEGTTVKILKDNAGWYKVECGTAATFYVASRYIKYLKPAEGVQLGRTTAKTSATGKLDLKGSDKAAESKIAEALAMVEEQKKLVESKQLANVNFGAVAKLFEEAADLAVTPGIKSTAIENARMFRRFDGLLTGINAAGAKIEMLNAMAKELQDPAKFKDYANKLFAAAGKLDSVSAFLINRAGSHKLINDGKVVAYLKTKPGDVDTYDKLCFLYGKFVGVKGNKEKADGADAPVITVDEVVEVTPDVLLREQALRSDTKTNY